VGEHHVTGDGSTRARLRCAERGLDRPGFGIDESPRFTRGVAVPGIPRVPVWPAKRRQWRRAGHHGVDKPELPIRRSQLL